MTEASPLVKPILLAEKQRLGEEPFAARSDCGEVTSLYHFPNVVSSIPPSWSTYPQILLTNNQLVLTNVLILYAAGHSVV